MFFLDISERNAAHVSDEKTLLDAGRKHLFGNSCSAFDTEGYVRGIMLLCPSAD